MCVLPVPSLRFHATVLNPNPREATLLLMAIACFGFLVTPAGAVDPLDCVPGHVIAGFEPGAVACECDSDPVILDAVDFEPSALGAFLASVPVSSIKMITSAWHAEASPDTNRWGERIRLADFAGATIRKCVKG